MMVYCQSDLNGKCKMQAPCLHVCTLLAFRQILQPQKCAASPAPQAHAKPTVCEGACDTHDGDHRLVRVVDKKVGYDWGLFWYCDEAIRIDKGNGLHVDEPNHEITGPKGSGA